MTLSIIQFIEMLNHSPQEILKKYYLFVIGFIIDLVAVILYFILKVNPLYGFIIGTTLIILGIKYPEN